MSADADDLLTKVGYATATTLSAPGYTKNSSTSINVGSTATWPTSTGVIFAIDEAEVVDSKEVRVDGTYNVFKGTVASGTSISNVDYIGGDSERSYSAGALTRVYMLPSSYIWNNMIDAMTAEHNQLDGTHTDITADSLTVANNIDINDSSTAIRDSSDNELVKFAKTSSAVNEITVTNAATGNAPQISATGGDTNIDLKFAAKGTGRIVLNGAGEPKTAIVNTTETTTSSTYTDLATAGPAVTVTIGQSGMALVSISSGLNMGAAGVGFARVGVALSGANTLAAGTNNAYIVQTSDTPHIRNGVAFLLTGLTAGSTTFTLKYAASANTATFADRAISVIPL